MRRSALFHTSRNRKLDTRAPIQEELRSYPIQSTKGFISDFIINKTVGLTRVQRLGAAIPVFARNVAFKLDFTSFTLQFDGRYAALFQD
jgi:hypothetical protein